MLQSCRKTDVGTVNSIQKQGKNYYILSTKSAQIVLISISLGLLDVKLYR